MKKLPVIIERSRTHLRGVAFKSSVMGSNFEAARIYEFESPDFDKQNEELNNFIRENFYENSGIYINLPSEELILRELVLPFISKSKIKDLLPFELESDLPYDITDIFYDYHFYPDVTGNESKIIVAAARKTFLEMYAQFFLANKMILKGVYIPVDALLQLSSFLTAPFGCILYVSGNYSILLMVREGSWEYSRVVPIGYDHLFAEISKKWKRDIAESKKLLTEIPVSDSDIVDSEYYQHKFKLTRAKSRDIVDSILNFSSSINHELKTTLSGFYRENETRNSVVLMSDLENQVFLENILTEKVTADIVPFPYGNTPISLIGRSFVIPVGMSFALSSGKDLNLMDSALKKLFKKKKDYSDNIIIAFLTASMLIFTGSFVVNFMQKRHHYQVIQKKKGELFSSMFNKTPDSNTSLVTQAKQLVEEQKKRSEIYKLQSNKLKLSQILFELNKALLKATDLQIDRWTYSNNSVTILGSTNDFNELNHIRSLALGNPIFASAEVKDQRSYPGPGGQNRVRFNLIIKPEVHDME
ncbi:MAG: hypothetical protein OEV66_02385 [Spirochaetia bacterium]|nr:hypothetical protein [Spirochaetia bacterium]